jgi:hypothetical protein
MAYVCNLSPSHRPPQPSLNNGPLQRRVRRAFVATGQSLLSTTQIMDWSLAPAAIGTMRAYKRIIKNKSRNPVSRTAAGTIH